MVEGRESWSSTKVLARRLIQVSPPSCQLSEVWSSGSLPRMSLSYSLSGMCSLAHLLSLAFVRSVSLFCFSCHSLSHFLANSISAGLTVNHARFLSHLLSHAPPPLSSLSLSLACPLSLFLSFFLSFYPFFCMIHPDITSVFSPRQVAVLSCGLRLVANADPDWRSANLTLTNADPD